MHQLIRLASSSGSPKNRGLLGQQPAARLHSLDDSDGHPDLSGVKGQPHPKRALEIAAAGQHSLLIV